MRRRYTRTNLGALYGDELDTDAPATYAGTTFNTTASATANITTDKVKTWTTNLNKASDSLNRHLTASQWTAARTILTRLVAILDRQGAKAQLSRPTSITSGVWSAFQRAVWRGYTMVDMANSTIPSTGTIQTQAQNLVVAQAAAQQAAEQKADENGGNGQTQQVYTFGWPAAMRTNGSSTETAADGTVIEMPTETVAVPMSSGVSMKTVLIVGGIALGAYLLFTR